MLLLLTEYLTKYYSGFNVFQYLTLRAILGVLTALMISLLFGPLVIRKLSLYQIGQHVRSDGPQSHLSKAGTPTMGGSLILVSIAITTLLWADLRDRYVWVVLLVTLLFGFIGWLDDYKKLVKKQSKGLKARHKYLLQSIFGLGAAVFLYVTAHSPGETYLIVPFFKHVAIPLGIGYILVAYLVVVGSSNAVNLTDGLDGLAIGCVVIAAGALTALTYVTSHARFAEYLDIQKLPLVGELTIFCGSVVGAALGFLWYNAHPAEMFMGDVGSLALGGAIGVVAVLIMQEILLLSIGGIFVVEAGSVILQVASFKLTGRRLFRMAPLHHHFELIGWSESKIIVRFWIVALVFALFSLTTLKLR